MTPLSEMTHLTVLPTRLAGYVHRSRDYAPYDVRSQYDDSHTSEISACETLKNSSEVRNGNSTGAWIRWNSLASNAERGLGLPHHRHPITTDEILAGWILCLITGASIVYLLTVLL